MTYTQSYSYTETYTDIDIEETFESLEADLNMIARRTDTWSSAYCKDVSDDLLKLLLKGYLKRIDITLTDTFDNPVKVAVYKVRENAGSWDGVPPGGNNWPSIPGGDLSVIISYSDRWYSLSDQEQSNFKEKLNRPWSTSYIDTSYPELTSLGSRLYNSNAFGLERQNWG